MTLDVQGFKRQCYDVEVAADGYALISQNQMQLLRRSAVVFSLIDTAKQEAEHNLETCVRKDGTCESPILNCRRGPLSAREAQVPPISSK
jgi:hypothetical protein